jgi:glycosyltransferase involved in cell wall biosynthesis
MSFLTTVIPVYNGAKYLLPTLQSVASQTRPTDRLIILDNCSTDNTAQVVRDFRSLACEWRQNERNLGLFGNLNRALTFATETDCLHLLTADDLIKPFFYERLMSRLDNCRGRVLAYTPYETIDHEGRLLFSPPTTEGAPERNLSCHEFLTAQSELRTALVPAIVIRTERQPIPCAFRPELAIVADSVFYAELATHCARILEYPEVLSQYRRHPTSTTDHKLHELKSWCLDEWTAMNLILDWIKEPSPQHWLRRQKLLCLFAARSRVKMKLVEHRAPEFARSIAAATRQITGTSRWCFGSLAVAIRDGLYALRGQTPEIYRTTKI